MPQEICWPNLRNTEEKNSTTYQMDMFISKGDNYVGGWTGSWTVSAKDLFDTDFINFRAYEKIPYPSSDEEIIGMLTEVGQESQNYPPQFGVKNE